MPQPTIGDAIEVYWPDDAKYYRGHISNFNLFTHTFCVAYEDGDVECLDLKTEQWRFAVRSRCENLLPPSPTDVTAIGRVESTDIVDAQMLVARCIWKYISRHRNWDRPPSTESCFRFALDMLCSIATTNHSISLSNGGEPFSCAWPQIVSQSNIHSIVEALAPHGSTKPDSKTRSNIEQLLCKLTRVIEVASCKVRLKVYESVCFRSIGCVLVALQISRS